jgi:phage tail-like protein
VTDGTDQLIVQLGSRVIQTVALTMDVLTIGRTPDNGLVLSNQKISRNHAEVHITPTGLMLTDLGSSNGTFVGNTRLLPHQPHPVSAGESFRIASFVMTYQPAARPVPAPEAPDAPAASEDTAAPQLPPPPPEPAPAEEPPAEEPEAPAPPPEPVSPPPVTLNLPAPTEDEEQAEEDEREPAAPQPLAEAPAQPARPPESAPTDTAPPVQPPAVPPPQTSGSPLAYVNLPPYYEEEEPEPAPLAVARPALPTRRISRDSDSRYLYDLPLAFQNSHSDFLRRFLLIFESIWEPLEQRQDFIHLYFDPRTCPEPFLAWLASWLDLSLQAHWPEARRRQLVAEAMELYRLRGTRYGLMRMIEVCTGLTPTITDERPAVFRVALTIPRSSDITREFVEQLVQAHKPAHAGYVLEVRQ